MVAVIKTGHSIHRILNYNENKVKEGVAEEVRITFGLQSAILCIVAKYLFQSSKMKKAV